MMTGSLTSRSTTNATDPDPEPAPVTVPAPPERVIPIPLQSNETNQQTAAPDHHDPASAEPAPGPNVCLDADPSVCPNADPSVDLNPGVTLDLSPVDLSPGSWRVEVAARLERYRTRRKPRSPRYPSLLLPFDAFETWSRTTPPVAGEQYASERLVAVNRTSGNSVAGPCASLETESLPFVFSPVPVAPQPRPQPAAPKSTWEPMHSEPGEIEALPRSAPPPNLIEFPRSAAIPISRLRELAEPIFDRPRIVEAPETLPPPPALGGMLLEPAPDVPHEVIPDVLSNVLPNLLLSPQSNADLPLRPAPASVARRTLAALVDAIILTTALAVFSAIFLTLNVCVNQGPAAANLSGSGWSNHGATYAANKLSTNPRQPSQSLPSGRLPSPAPSSVRLSDIKLANLSLRPGPAPIRGSLPILAAALALVAVLFWMAYEFLFVVYTGSTPGLRAARLRLAKFDGEPLPRRARRWRVLASFLSAFSAGLGYLWCLLDPQGLCWHDRITRTQVLQNT